MQDLAQPYIINFTPTGMVPTREMTPHVPTTPREIIEEIDDLCPLGISMVHLHARDETTGEPTCGKDAYAPLVAGVRERHPELIVGVSTSGRRFPEFGQRAGVLDLDGDLKPDFASLTLSSMNFAREPSLNAPRMVQDLARRMLDRGIRPELEVFDLGMMNVVHYLLDRELVRPPCYINLLLGNVAGAQADPGALGLLLRDMPAGATWAAGGLGTHQPAAHALALASGGGVRVGIEDNIWLNRARTEPATNRQLVERVLAMGRALERRPCTPAEARSRLGLPPSTP